MLLSGFIANSVTLDSSIANYFEDTNLADLWVYSDGVEEDDEEFFKSLKTDGVIKEYDKRFYLETSVIFKDLEIQNNSKIYVSEGNISKPYIESGRIEEGWGCLIDKHAAEDRHIQIGVDRINFTYEIERFGMTIPLEFEFVVTGTMSLDECADTYSSWPIFFDETYFLNGLNSAIEKAINGEEISQKLQELGISTSTAIAFAKQDKVPYNQVLVKTDDTSIATDKIEEYYETASSNLAMILDREKVESVVLLSSEVSQSKKMIYVFPVIFLIVSVLVILTTINQLVLQEKTKIGTLKSIGVPDRKILNHYSKYGAVLCLIGSVIGIVLGVLVIPRIMLVKYNLVYSLPADYIKLKIPFLWLLIALAGMVLLGYLVSLLVCHGILHKKPIECLRHDVNINVKFKGGKKKNKLPLPVKMAVRNIKVKPVRTVMATIGIAGCVALLLCGFGITDTLTHSIDNDFGNVFRYDITSTYNKDDFLVRLEELDGFEYYEKNDKLYCEIKSDSFVKSAYVYEIEEHSKLSGIYLENDEVCISKAIADDLGVLIGDKVNVTVGGTTVELQINKMIETSAINGIFVARDLGFNELLKTKGVWIKCSNPNADAVAFVNSINGTDSAYSMSGMRERVFQKVSSIDLMTATLKTFAILLAVVVLLNLIFLIVKERIREIATLKVLGMNIFSITLSIFFEILFMAVLGTALGMCLGYPLMVLVLKINRVEIMNYLYFLKFTSFLLTILIIFATIIATTALCLFKIKKVQMVESLKSVE